MTRLLIMFCFFATTLACKTDNKQNSSTDSSISNTSTSLSTSENNELTAAERIANAHGYKKWKDVKEISFTFNVDRGENHFERSWTWQPQKKYVVSAISKDSIYMYTRTNMDSTSIAVDKSFVNDKFWLLVPFQLVWDEGTTISEPVKAIAPISKVELNQITLTYTGDGGYTPSDAYDIFYDDNFMIKEWVFRKGNIAEPSMITTFENYEDYGGIKIAKDHKTPEGDFNLYFSNIKIKK
ncbi:MAG: hypothetical protein WA775_14170 [Psychroserpens sp.]|uniref:hypothetical protein n=1 Tax=Psychroserpens sp. TaxID=2020870 RepID=UPI003CC405D2